MDVTSRASQTKMAEGPKIELFIKVRRVACHTDTFYMCHQSERLFVHVNSEAQDRQKTDRRQTKDRLRTD